MHSPTAPDLPLPFFRRPAFGLALLIGAAIAIRARMLFGTPLVPGMNGAYYLVQARSLLEHGQLGIPDLPLTFWLHAALAKLIQLLSGLPQDDAIVWAVKLADATLPPLAAVPVAWMARRWSARQADTSSLVWLLPAAIVCLGAQALRMTGDFQKNSLALVWLAALAPATFSFLRKPTARTMVAPLGLLALLGLTHVGVLGAALVFCASLAGTALLRAERGQKRHILALVLSGSAVLTLASAITYTLYDPARVARLATAFASPLSFAEGHEAGRREPGQPPPARAQMAFEGEVESASDGGEGFTPARSSRVGMAGEKPAPPSFDRPRAADATPSPALNAETFRIRDASAEGSGEAEPDAPPFGGPPPHEAGPQGMRFDPRTALPMATCLLAGGVALWVAWRRRDSLPMAESSVVVAAAVTCTLLALPLFDAQKSERLVLIAAVPAAVAGSFVLSRFTTKVWVHWLGAASALVLLAGAARTPPMGHNAGVSATTIAELRSIAPLIEKPEQTLIVARHGLEWWTAWTLHTHIAQPMAVTERDWSNYAHVLYLQEKRQMGPPDMPGAAPDRRVRQEAMPAAPPFGPGMGGMELPANATTLHDGDNLTLAHVAQMPRRGPPRLGWR